MKKIIVLFLGLVLVGNVFALDLGKVEEVWDKSMDIAITELDNLKDFDIPKAEDVEAKVNNEMYVTELESKVKQIEAEVSLLKQEKDELEKENKAKMYRVSPSKNGNYYVVECSYDGGKTWHFVDSSTDLEEANKKMEYLKKGLTASGLTQEEAKASIPEGTQTIGDSDQNSKTKSKSTKKRIKEQEI